MKRRFGIPIRFKFMLTFLVLVTAVVGMITFSTANLFQDDKEAYVNDLIARVAQGVVEETGSWLTDVRDRLAVFADIIGNSGLTPEEKSVLAARVFGRFGDLIGLHVSKQGESPIAVYDTAGLEAVGLERAAVEAAAVGRLADPPPPGEIRVLDTTADPRRPTFVIVFALDQAPDDGRRLEPTLVEATLRSDKLGRIVARYGGHDVFVLDSAGGLLAASDPKELVDDAPAPFEIGAGAADAAAAAAATIVRYDDGDRPMIGSYARSPVAGLVAGAGVPRSAANLASQRLMARLLAVAGVLLVLAVALGFLWALRITRPVEDLVEATHRVAQGDFDVEVKADSSDEIGNLADSFTQMAGELHRRAEALEEAQGALIQSEKMAAFGQLGAGLAHEIKNPLAGILACAQISKRGAEADSQLRKDLELIEKETKRCRSIIDNLLRFARQEKSVKAPTNINSVISDSVAIVNHQMDLAKVKLDVELADDLPDVLANGNQLQQVFMNLLINAQQAMDGEPGSVRVRSFTTPSGQIGLEFADTGPGMTEEVKAKLFEPFFTTKPAGKGTGLGMSVSYGVIRDHEGTIRVDSELGEGATFTITLPCFVDAAASADHEPSTGAVEAVAAVVAADGADAGAAPRAG